MSLPRLIVHLTFLFTIYAFNSNKLSLYSKNVNKNFVSRSKCVMADSIVRSDVKNDNVMNKFYKAADVMYKFSRPHTIKVFLL
jgi:hypothetical protein